MGDTIWLETTDGNEKAGDEQDNSVMLRLSRQLDKIASSLGVEKLSGFYNTSGLEALFATEFKLKGARRKSRWFDSAVRRRSVEAVLSAIRENPSLLGNLDSSQSAWPGYLVAELAYCQEVLRKAEAAGHRFRFRIVS